MGTVYNIRGTNGSGKSTLARAFLPDLKGNAVPCDGGPVDLNWYDAPTKKDPDRRLRVEGHVKATLGQKLIVGTVGPYRTACGGLDAVPSFSVQQDAIRDMLMRLLVPNVIAEGVLASTVYGSWAVFADYLERSGDRLAWVYLTTPLEVCLERIQARQRAAGKEREIKTDLVADKVKAINATRTKALAAGRLVYDLPFGAEVEALTAIMDGKGEMYRGA
jgi:hypothetical protein